MGVNRSLDRSLKKYKADNRTRGHGWGMVLEKSTQLVRERSISGIGDYVNAKCFAMFKQRNISLRGE